MTYTSQPYFPVHNINEETRQMDGYFQTDVNGDILNAAGTSGTYVNDAWGAPLLLPRGVASAAQDGSTAGLYHITFQWPMYKILSVQANLLTPTITSGEALRVIGFNPQATALTAGKTQSAVTLDIQYAVSGSATHLVYGAFCISLTALFQKQANS
jgi:hypothetical protein